MRKAKLNKPDAPVGPKRLARLLTGADSRKGLVDRIRNARAAARKIKRPDPTGSKTAHVPGREKEEIKTPYMRKEVARRRAANKRARKARRLNRK